MWGQASSAGFVFSQSTSTGSSAAMFASFSQQPFSPATAVSPAAASAPKTPLPAFNFGQLAGSPFAAAVGTAPQNAGPAFPGFAVSSGTVAAFGASAPLQDVVLARESVTNLYVPAHLEYAVPLVGDCLQLVSCRVHSDNLCMYGFELGQYASPHSGCFVTSVSPGGPAHLSGKIQIGQNLCVACLHFF